MNKIDPISRRTLIIMAVVGLGFVVSSLYFGRWQITGGVLAGVLIALADFWLIQRVVNYLLRGSQRGFLLSIYLIKFATLCGVLYVFARVLGLDVLAIAVGFSVLVVATVLSGLMGVDDSIGSAPETQSEAVDLESSDG